MISGATPRSTGQDLSDRNGGQVGQADLGLGERFEPGGGDGGA